MYRTVILFCVFLSASVAATEDRAPNRVGTHDTLTPFTAPAFHTAVLAVPDTTRRRVPATGMFLIAARGMRDPRFQESVVLMIEHGAGGSMGVIINRPTGIALADVLPRLEGADKGGHGLYFGGPVAANVLLLLTRAATAPALADHVFADVYVSGSRSMLEQLLGAGTDHTRLRVYAGHASWAPGQLVAELQRGDWHLAAGEPPMVFAREPEGLWRELIERHAPAGITVQRRPGRRCGSLLAPDRSRPPGGADLCQNTSAGAASAHPSCISIGET